MIKKIIILIIAFGVGWWAVSFFSEKEEVLENPIRQESEIIEGEEGFYQNNLLGIRFAVPDEYYLEEREIGNGEREHYFISLTLDTEENRLVREGKALEREGPIAITVGAYQNNLDMLSIDEWVENSSYSNYKLATSDIEEISISGKRTLSYSHTGLYEADVLIMEHEGRILMFSVTYFTQEDDIRKVFEQVINTLSFF